MLQEKGSTAAIIIQRHPEHGSRVYGASSAWYPPVDRSALVTNPLLGPRGILMSPANQLEPAYKNIVCCSLIESRIREENKSIIVENQTRLD
ncbi:hypothetical protein HZH68_000602 [Vespula germanica]|uniref:Uncharacterized protein n=2 Tax=Vespula TaxID=7451 RepID=A0A834U5X0_VESGE|nr:hypothetical protein HZH66_000547 [Vespula vulgaris]KAF7417949.1 hypothetical protein HZH68_000602 [Vespula germanica]